MQFSQEEDDDPLLSEIRAKLNVVKWSQKAIETLISSYKKREALYDRQHIQYSVQCARRNLVKEIRDEIVEACPNLFFLTVDDVRSKVKILRIRLREEIKKAIDSNNKHKSKYTWYQQLQFLKPHMALTSVGPLPRPRRRGRVIVAKPTYFIVEDPENKDANEKQTATTSQSGKRKKQEPSGKINKKVKFADEMEVMPSTSSSNPTQTETKSLPEASTKRSNTRGLSNDSKGDETIQTTEAECVKARRNPRDPPRNDISGKSPEAEEVTSPKVAAIEKNKKPPAKPSSGSKPHARSAKNKCLEEMEKLKKKPKKKKEPAKKLKIDDLTKPPEVKKSPELHIRGLRVISYPENFDNPFASPTAAKTQNTTGNQSPPIPMSSQSLLAPRYQMQSRNNRYTILNSSSPPSLSSPLLTIPPSMITSSNTSHRHSTSWISQNLATNAVRPFVLPLEQGQPFIKSRPQTTNYPFDATARNYRPFNSTGSNRINSYKTYFSQTEVKRSSVHPNYRGSYEYDGDDLDFFGRFLVLELRAIRSESTQIMLKRKIMQLIERFQNE